MPYQAGAYMVDERRARSTSVTIQVFDTKHVDNTYGDGARWVIRCVAHDSTQRDQKQEVIYKLAGKPQEWCSGCKELFDNGQHIEVESKKTRERREVRQAIAERQETIRPSTPIPTLDDTPVESLHGHMWERAGKCSRCHSALRAPDGVYHSVINHNVTEAACCACVSCNGNHGRRN